MEDGARNGGLSGGVVKSRNSTGCLIIKNNKGDGEGGGSAYSGPDIVYTRKEKKRPRLLESDSESSDDELPEFYRRGAGLNQVSTSGNSRVKKGVAKGSEFARKESVDFGRDDIFPPKERKMGTLDVYDFDEYDELDVGYFDTYGSGRISMISGGRRGLEAGSSKRGAVMGARKRSFLESSSSERIRGSRSFDGEFGIKNKLPVPALKERIEPRSNEAIRLQGKNGVLKVMAKNKVVASSIAKQYEEFDGISMSRSRELTPKNAMVRRPLPVYLEQKVLNEPNDIDRVQTGKVKPRNFLPPKGVEDSDEQSEESEERQRILSSNAKTPRPTKRGRSEAEVTPSPESVQVLKSKEAKVKRGSGTEKQLLREKIRNLLVSAGWTIDYRPRRNRDYFDAVYINPTGTAYWSIIKAYDALQKQIEEDGAEAGREKSGVNLIPDDTLSKLTRQTQKKLEKEMKRKNRENNQSKRKKKAASGKFVDDDPETDCTDSGSEEEKLSSYIKQSGGSKGRLHDFRNGNGRIQVVKVQERIEVPSSHAIHGRKTRKIGRCTLLVRNADKGLNSEGDKFVPYKGKRTILSWLIDSGMVKLSEKVLYMNRRRTKVMLEGWITRDGIHCGCCSKILTVSKFEIHAASKLRQPYQNMCLPSGVSLLQCQVNAWNNQEDSQRTGFHEVDVDGDDPNDDTCGICGDGGNLICCDGCPSTLHQSCVGIEMIPPGDWHCPHCSCKFCGFAHVEPSQSDENTSNELVDCSLCERKYHKTCIPETDSISYNSSNQISFCGTKCQELFEQLQKLLGVKHDLDSGLSWSLIHRNNLDADPSHRGFSQKVEWNAKLAVSMTVMNECFLPITDRRSGINMIQNVLYNCRSNFNRLNYGGFYTAILERGDEIISAASIRIHGSKLAEMPFIGTRHIYRRQGMCRRLLVAIETALRSLKVEKLIIPAISDMMHTWTKVFGFSALGELQKQEMKSLNMLVFPGTDMLKKKLVEVTSKRDVTVCKGTDSCKDVGGSSPLPDSTKGSDVETSPSETTASDPIPHNDQSIEKSDVPQNDHIVEKPDAGLSLNSASLLSSGLDVSSDTKEPIKCKMSQEMKSSSELEDTLTKHVPNDTKIDCPLEATEGVVKDRHVDKAVAESVVGLPDSDTDVKNPSSNPDTQNMGKPVLAPPTESNDQAGEMDNGASKLDDKTTESVPLNKNGALNPAIEDSTEPLVKSELDATPVRAAGSEGTDEPRIQVEESKPDSSTSGNIQLHDEGERGNSVLDASGLSLNGTLTSVVCSDSILESRSLSPVQVADHSQMEQQFEVTVPDTKLISVSRADYEFNVENKADSTHEINLEVAGAVAGCNPPGDGSTQI